MDSDRGMSRGRNSKNSSKDNYHQSRKSAAMSDNDYFKRNSIHREEDKENYHPCRQSTHEADHKEKKKTPAQSVKKYYADRQKSHEPEVREIKSKTCVSDPETNSSYSSQISNTSCMSNHSADDCDAKSEKMNSSNRSMLISPKNKDRLRNLIKKHPEGILCAELPAKFVDTYCVTFNYADLGFNSVREVASELPEIFHCVKLVEGGDYKLFNAQEPLPVIQKVERRIPQSEEPCKKHEDAAFPKELDPDILKKLIPKGAMEINESVGHISVIELFKDKQYEEIFLSELYTPTNFYIQLKRRQLEFKKLMSDLQAFYEEKKTKYGLHPIMVEKNLNIACLYEKIWHRGIIKSVGEDKRCLIYFYDFGTVKSYNPEKLFFLDRRFSYLPAQAIACGLYNTKPRSSKRWDARIIYEFKRKVWNIPLMATVASDYTTNNDFFNIENNSLLVSLTDTRKTEDFHINDWMTEIKFAKQGRLVHTKNRNFAFNYYVDCLKQKGYDPSIIRNLSDSNVNIEDPILCRDFNFESKNAPRHSLPLPKEKKVKKQNRESSSLSSSFGATSSSVKIASDTPKTSSSDRFNSLQKLFLKTQIKSSNSSISKNVNLANNIQSKELQRDKKKYDVDTQVKNIPNLKKVDTSVRKPESSSITEVKETTSKNVDNSEKPAAISSKDVEDSPEDLLKLSITSTKSVDAPKVWKQNLPLIKSEISNFINKDSKSTFYENNVGFVPSGNIKTTTASVSPVLKLKQRLQSNSSKSISVLVSSRIAKVLKGENQNEDNSENLSEKNDSKRLFSEERKNLEEKKDKLEKEDKDNKAKLEEEVPLQKDFISKEMNSNDEFNQISFVKIKTMKRGLRVPISDKSESLDSDDLSCFDDECELSNKEVITFPKQAPDQLVFNDVDVNSDTETWDLMSMLSNDVTPTNF